MILKFQLPADEIILDDVDVTGLLKISKRKLADLRAKRLIEFHPTSDLSEAELEAFLKSGKGRGVKSSKIYYKLQGVLDYVNRHTVPPIYKQNRLAS